MFKKLHIISLVLIFCMASLFFTFSHAENSYAQDKNISDTGQEIFDYILIIDESGSMKKNDPENTRIDAAKFFMDLTAVLNEESRVCVIGFGEEVNVYFNLQDIKGNKEEVKKALDNIKSSQPLTDMKAAFLKALDIINLREIKNNSAIIFLTDGSLTLDDIPKEDSAENRQGPQREEEGDRPVRVKPPEPGETANVLKEKNTENEILMYRDREQIRNVEDGSDVQKSYLEQYKQELLDTCFNLGLNNTKIYPIAFTEEAEIKLLNDIAFITGTASYYAENAINLRDVYLDIFGSINNSFIKTSEQQSEKSISGIMELKDYMEEFAVIAVENEKGSEAKIDISSDKELITEKIVEKQYEIIKVLDISNTELSYSISGDAVFIFDMAKSFITEPQKAFYLSGSQVSLGLELEKINDLQKTVEYSDFFMTYSIEYPDGSKEENINLPSSGRDGNIFSSTIENMSQKGIHTLEFYINHKGTGSVSSKKIIINIVDLGYKFEPLMPSDKIEIGSSDIDFKIPISARLVKSEGASKKLDPSKTQIVCTIKDDEDKILREVPLSNQNSSAEDSILFEGFIDDLTDTGLYKAEFYIIDSLYSDNKIGTGKGLEFEIIKKGIPEETVSKTSQTEDIEQTQDIKNNQFKYINIIIIAAAVFLVIITAAAVFFILRFKRKRH